MKSEATAPRMSEEMKFALRVVEVMGGAGLTVAPVEPDGQMAAAGKIAGATSDRSARDIYRAMLGDWH